MITFEELLRYAKIKKFHNNDETTKLESKVENFIIIFPEFKSIADRLISCNMTDKEIKNIKEDFDKLIDKILNENNKFSNDNDKSKPIIEFFNEEKDITALDSSKEDLLDYQDEDIDEKPLKNNLDDLSYVQEEIPSDSLVEDENFENSEYYTKDELFKNPKLLKNLNDEQKRKVQELIENENVLLINPSLGIGIDDYSKTNSIETRLSNDDVNLDDYISDNIDEDVSSKSTEDLSMMMDESKSIEEDSFNDDMIGYMKHQENNERPKIMTLANGDNRGFAGTFLLTIVCSLFGLMILFISGFLK